MSLVAPVVRNPYLNRSMIRSVGEFCGRRRELSRIMARIGASTPQSVSLVGERRVGKSSLLWHMAQPEVCAQHVTEPERYIFLSIDFQGNQHLDQDGFCRVFGEQLNAAAGERLAVEELSGLSGLETAVQAVDRAGLHLVCLFDEFETVTRNTAIGSEFYGVLRSLANAYQVAYVTASRQNLHRLCHSQEISESPFFNIFADVRVGAMPDSEVREIIEQPSAAAGLPLGEHAGAIGRLGGNLPFFVQIACSAAFETLQESADGTLDERQLQRGFLEEAASHFQYLWGVFDETERAALVTLAEGGAIEGEVLDNLESTGYVTVRDDGARLFSEAFGRFVLDEAGRGREGATGAPPSQAAEAPGSGTSPWGRLALAAVFAVLVLGGGTWLWLGGSAAGPVAAQVTSLDAVSQLGIEVFLYYRSGVEVGQTALVPAAGAAEPVSLGPGDQLRLAAVAHRACGLSLFADRGDGVLAPVHDGTSTRPLRLDPGRTTPMPSGSDAWLTLSDGGAPARLWVLAAEKRLTEVEKLYDRYRQAPPDQRVAAHAALAEVLGRIAAIRVDLPSGLEP